MVVTENRLPPPPLPPSNFFITPLTKCLRHHSPRSLLDVAFAHRAGFRMFFARNPFVVANHTLHSISIIIHIYKITVSKP